MVYTFEDKTTIPDQIWPYSSDIASQGIPLIIDNGLSENFSYQLKLTLVSLFYSLQDLTIYNSATIFPHWDRMIGSMLQL